MQERFHSIVIVVLVFALVLVAICFIPLGFQFCNGALSSVVTNQQPEAHKQGVPRKRMMKHICFGLS